MDTISLNKISFIKSLLLLLFILVFLITWIWTFVGAYDLYTWLMENILLFMLVAAALLTYRKYPFSHLSYILLITFLLLHLYGARYTYENNPLGLWIQQLTGSSRNSYDRIVHFSFGLIWTYPVYELWRKHMKQAYLIASILSFTSICTLAAFYELIEWIIGGIFFPDQGTAFIGLQGDPWDTQKDIFLGVFGSLIALISLLVKKRRNTKPYAFIQELTR